MEWRSLLAEDDLVLFGHRVLLRPGIAHETGVPVGLIVSAVNGTRIEPWTPANRY